MPDHPWWQTTVFYQIYPRSFADSNGDGIGDLDGIIQKLDYVKSLGVGGIWLSPHYPSPLYDCGYDIADYTGVAPEYGTLDTFKRLLEEAHARDLRVIIDLVLNHTSDQHPWFIESRSSLDNPKRDWYVWHPGTDGEPPNNWRSLFGGSAWELDELTEQYYYHIFFAQQPDLNWRNREVWEAAFDVVRFWLDLGVDGFRLDAISTIFEDPALPDHEATMSQAEIYRARRSTDDEERAAAWAQHQAMLRHQFDQPEVHELFRALRKLVDEYDDRVLVGETDEVEYYGEGNDELHLTFNFPLMRAVRLTPVWVRANQRQRLGALPPGAWPCNTLNNHDTARVWSGFGDGEHDAELARLSLALMLTLRGTPFLYNGEEIGMTDLILDELGQFRDMWGVWLYHAERDMMGSSPEEALDHAAQFTRDRCRTPMQWTSAPNAGFCPADVKPWLPVHPNHAEGVNVADQEADPDSMLHFYRQLIGLRQATPALVLGDYEPLHEEAEDYLAFLRATDEQRVLVVLNFFGDAHTLRFDLPGTPRVLFSTHEHATDETLDALPLSPFEIYVAVLTE